MVKKSHFEEEPEPTSDDVKVEEMSEDDYDEDHQMETPTYTKEWRDQELEKFDGEYDKNRDGYLGKVSIDFDH